MIDKTNNNLVSFSFMNKLLADVAPGCKEVRTWQWDELQPKKQRLEGDSGPHEGKTFSCQMPGQVMVERTRFQLDKVLK